MMKKFLIASAAAALAFGASAGFAQGTDPERFVVGDGDTMRVMGGDNAEGVVILGSRANPGVPATCPEGSLFWSSENTLTECGTDGATYVLTEPASGTMMMSGEPFPDGARVLTAQDDEGTDSDPNDSDVNEDGSGGTDTGGTRGTSGSGPGS